MDIIQYISGDDAKLRALAKRSRLQILRLKRLVADPSQPVRYMTARRLTVASDGQITMEAMAQRGPMRGEETFAGPLGRVISGVACQGPDIPSRLAEAGISSDHFTEVLLRGRVPRPAQMEAYLQAFAPDLREDHFRQHAEWRRGQTGEAGGLSA